MKPMRFLLALVVAVTIFCPFSAAQSFYSGQAMQPVVISGSPQPTLGPIPFAGVRVCSTPLTQTSPCLPLATVTDQNGNTLSNSIGSNFGQLSADNLGRFVFGCSTGSNLQLQYAGASNAAAANVPISCPGLGSNPQLSGLTISGPIISTVSTGTAPFSIASTTVVPNLNSQLHNGLTAPASAIVGISDSQVLSNKTLSSPTINTPTITSATLDGVGAAHVASQVSAATNYGTALASQTIIASLPSTGNVSLTFLLQQVTAGVGCSAATNSVTVNGVTWTAPGGTVETANPSSNMGFTGNGAVDSGSATFGTSAFTNNGLQAIVAKAGTAITYTTTSTLASTGCTTTPQYVIYAKAVF